jgi:hypothetical protein
VARAAVLAGLVAFALLTGAQTFDQPRPRGAETAREQAPPRGPTPPFGGAPAAPARGCPRETLVRFGMLEVWLRQLPLGRILAALATRRLIGSCSA